MNKVYKQLRAICFNHSVKEQRCMSEFTATIIDSAVVVLLCFTDLRLICHREGCLCLSNSSSSSSSCASNNLVEKAAVIVAVGPVVAGVRILTANLMVMSTKKCKLICQHCLSWFFPNLSQISILSPHTLLLCFYMDTPLRFDYWHTQSFKHFFDIPQVAVYTVHTDRKSVV